MFTTDDNKYSRRVINTQTRNVLSSALSVLLVGSVHLLLEVLLVLYCGYLYGSMNAGPSG